MDRKFDTLKSTFHGIKNIREEINSIFANLEVRVIKLKDIYKEFINKNSTTLFIFGLDSFYFQNKLIDNECSDMKKFYDLIMNRMYCEYYKLYKIILEYVNTNLSDDEKFIDSIRNKNVYPAYKDLEPYKQYSFTLIDELHNDITDTLIAMNNYLSNRQHVLSSYKLRSDVGLNINNFVSTYEFEVASVEGQLTLFCSYIDFFHELHLKYLKRFAMKIQIIYGQVDHDINFDEVSLNNKSDKKQYMNEMKHEIGKKTYRELRSSVHIDQHRGELMSDSDESTSDKEVIDFNNHIKAIIDISEQIESKKETPVSDAPVSDAPVSDAMNSDEPNSDMPFMSMPFRNVGVQEIVVDVREIDVQYEVQENMSEVQEASVEVQENMSEVQEASVEVQEVEKVSNDDDWLNDFVEVNNKKNKPNKKKNKKKK
jgi:hypothetical protein